MKERLGNYIQEYSVRNKNGEDIPVYSVTNTQGFCKDYFGKEVASKDKTTYKIVPRGCFAYNPSRINVGSVDYQRYEDKVIVSPLYNVFTVSDNLDKRYLYYYLKSDIALQRIRNVASGSVRDNLKLSMLYEFPINVRDIEEQRSIVYKLDQIRNIIDLRQKELEQLDELVKARFVELFGDPRINPKGYDIVPISSLFDVGSSKRVFESDWREAGVPFYRAREIVKLSRDGYVDNELFIEESMYEAYKEKYGVPKAGDMMVTGVGTLGVCYIVKETDRFYFKDGNTLWFKNKGLCDVRFIKDQYDMDFVKGQITANANVSTVGTYTITNANNTLVLLPPLEEQGEYVAFCSLVDKSKFVGAICIDKIQSKEDYYDSI